MATVGTCIVVQSVSPVVDGEVTVHTGGHMEESDDWTSSMWQTKDLHTLRDAAHYGQGLVKLWWAVVARFPA